MALTNCGAHSDCQSTYPTLCGGARLFAKKNSMDLAQLDSSVEGFAKSVFLIIWRNKYLFTFISVTTFAAAILALLAVQPLYEGATLLVGGQTGLEQVAEGERRPTENPIALSRIAESEEVVSVAVEKVGLDRLTGGAVDNTPSLFARLRHWLFSGRCGAKTTPCGRSRPPVPRIKRALSVRSEINSDVIRIAFTHRDPAVAAQFANAVAQAFVDRQSVLYSRAGAADFFSRQQQRFEDEARQMSDELGRFAARTSIYDADNQKQLLLKRLNDLEAALAVTRGNVSQKLGERAALADELRKLAPVTRSQYVSSLVDMLGGDRSTGALRNPDPRPMDERAADPPLLLVRVYQDSMVTLFKVNADLIGVQSLQRQQAEEVDKITAGLNKLTENEQEYTQLKRALDRVAYNANMYSKRTIDEQINAESRAARFSSVKVLQRATVPLRPVSPNYLIMTAAAAFGSALLGFGVAWLRQGSQRSMVVRAQT